MFSENYSSNRFATPSKSNSSRVNRMTLMQSTVDLSFDDQKNFITPVKSFSESDYFNYAPKKESKIDFSLFDCKQVTRRLFENNLDEEYEKSLNKGEDDLLKIRGLLLFYKVTFTTFDKADFLIWLKNLEEFKLILFKIGATILTGFNEQSMEFFRFLVNRVNCRIKARF
jgi:hypothetical protein